MVGKWTESPCEDRLVGDVAQDLLLQTDKRPLPTFSVDCGHLDVEDAEEGVSSVLLPRRLTGRRPRHAMRDRDIGEALVEGEDCLIDSRDLLYIRTSPDVLLGLIGSYSGH